MDIEIAHIKNASVSDIACWKDGMNESQMQQS